MTIKRAILALLTLLAIARIAFSLNDSLSEPQIQSRLELYQTNLVLYVAEFKSNEESDFDLNTAVDSLVGEDPYAVAAKQYQKVRKETKISRAHFETQLQQLTIVGDDSKTQTVADNTKIQVAAQKSQLNKQIDKLDDFVNEIDLKQGILNTAKKKEDKALSIWNQLITRVDDSENEYAKTAMVLSNLWQEKPQPLAQSEAIIKDNLDSWFRYQALEKLYQIENRLDDLAVLQAQKQELATQSIFKLALISGIPVVGGIGGVILLIFLIVQWFIKKETAIISTNSNHVWETPWDWEITWQVLIVGFFFVGQFVLPLLLGIFGINPVNSSLRIKALYVFGTYILMTLGGISVLYFSIKSFFPLPQDWFKFKLVGNWFVWGFGGYLVAIPLVLIVSLINQQIWQGQGGSNPLLFLALQAQDKAALAIFLITASIAAPIFEEIMFRGFLLPSLTRYIPVWGAIIISGLIFAIAHLSLSEVLPLATLGVILGTVYTRSRNLLAPMLLHSLWNSGTLISLFVLGNGV
jgi:uncharacterized protein